MEKGRLCEIVILEDNCHVYVTKQNGLKLYASHVLTPNIQYACLRVCYIWSSKG